MYLPNTDADRQTMLDTIGVGHIEELFTAIPDDLKLSRPLDLPTGLTELELTAQTATRTSRDTAAASGISFLGCGAYDHFIPAVVDALAGDPRFVTAYTPYQAEASQGSLELFFEYQSLIARLTGMDLSNASHYDGATACVEAVLMAVAATRRRKILIAGGFSEEYLRVLTTYVANLELEIVSCHDDPNPGCADPEFVRSRVDAETACVLVQHPNQFGILEDVDALSGAAHRGGALFAVCVDPISLGLLKRPDTYGADIVVAEGQPLGIPLGYGGPYLGILACRESLLRRLPGRLVGQTVDRRGNRCWVLTMQTREQHIRREKATSNICSNQGLMAIRACIYLAALGPVGLREVAELCLRKSHYLAEQLTKRTPFVLAYPESYFFKEFVVRIPKNEVASLVEALASQGIFAGVPQEETLTIAVTEKRTREEMDRFVDAVAARYDDKTGKAAQRYFYS